MYDEKIIISNWVYFNAYKKHKLPNKWLLWLYYSEVTMNIKEQGLIFNRYETKEDNYD